MNCCSKGADEMADIIKVEHLSYVYNPGLPTAVTALDDVSFTVEEGDFVGIIGATGSGKSTLITHMNGLNKPTSGKIYIDGRDLWADPEKIRDFRFLTGLVFQYPEYQLFEETCYKDIAFGPKNMGLDEAEVDRRVHEAADFVGLDPALLERSPFELSGGQKRRVAIAGVIAMEPKVLVLDEPRRGREFFRTFDLPAYLRKHFNMFGGTEYRVTLRCAADLEPVMRERFGREPVFCPEDAEHFHFDVPICVSQQFFGWVCGFGGKVEITAPAAVRAQLHEMLQSLAEQHG